MSQETLRQQMAKLRGKFPQAPSNPLQPKTMMRGVHKSKPRIVVSGDPVADAAKIEAVVARPKQPWTDRAKGKVSIAIREANAISVMTSVKSNAFALSLENIDREITSIRKKAVVEAQVGTSRELTAVRRDAETVVNLVKTIREGNRVNDVEPGHLPNLAKQMKDHLTKLRESLIALATPKVERHVPEGELINEANVAAFRVRYKRLLETALHEHRDKAFFFINQPVLPVFDGIVKSSVMLNAGLPVEDMAGYPVLLNQKLLVLNPELVDGKGHDRDGYVLRVIDLLNKQSKQSFILAHEPNQAVVQNHMAYYWIMPNDSYKIMCAAGGPNTSIRQWGLAF